MGRLKEAFRNLALGASPFSCTGAIYCPEASQEVKEAISGLTGLSLEEVEQAGHLNRGQEAMMSGGGIAHEGYRVLHKQGTVIIKPNKHATINPDIQPDGSATGPVQP